jgi:hypothetical protein
MQSLASQRVVKDTGYAGPSSSLLPPRILVSPRPLEAHHVGERVSLP